MSVLLYSTGLDSELYRLLEAPDTLLMFASGARYEQRELEQLEKFKGMGLLNGHSIIVDRTLNFKSLEQANAIVPMRNIFYLLRAFEFSNEVLLGVTHYDLHYDKQEDVLNGLTSFIQNYYYFRDIPDTWDNVHPKVLTPYRDYTKGEMLAEAIARDIDVSHIPTLRTCYDAHSIKGCGKCKSCVQKAIALAVNGLFDPKLFDEDPRIAGKEWLAEYLEISDGTISTEVFTNEMQTLLDT